MKKKYPPLPIKPKLKPKIMAWIAIIVFFILAYPFISLYMRGFMNSPKLVICKETTGLDNPPLRANGMVDYAKYFNDVNSKGITPENNFINAWIDIVGQEKFIPASDERVKYCKAIGYDSSKNNSGCFISYEEIPQGTLSESDIFNAMGICVERPWKAKQYPYIAEYIRKNIQAMELLRVALDKPYCYLPIIETNKMGIVSAIWPKYNYLREMAKLFVFQANNLVEQGRLDEAWKDVLTVRRLGLILYDNPKDKYSTVIITLVGTSITTLSDKTADIILSDKRLSSEQARIFRKEWLKYPSPKISAKSLLLTERAMILSAMVYIFDSASRGKIVQPDGELTDKGIGLTCRYADLNYVARRINYAYDLLEKSVGDTPMEQLAAKDSEDIRQLNEHLDHVGLHWTDIFKLWAPPTVQSHFSSDLVVDLLLSLLYPSLDGTRLLIGYEEAKYNLVDIGLALREYQLTKGGYPEKLVELVPDYFKELPKDPFSGKDYIYKRTKDGFKLYSIGKNFKDDGGVVIEDHPREGDIVLEIPIPEKSEKKK